MPSNRLIHEKSPYLLQHAHNPVDWHPWSDEAFEQARSEDKPVFLSIGYATCHWCHVMEKESFEDPEAARYLNDTFVCIKVDREERPDIDSVYMAACNMLTGSGGWPLTIFMTPEREPFFAATYIPKEARFNRMGLVDLCRRVKEMWTGEREKLSNSAAGISKNLVNAFDYVSDGDLDETVFEKAYDQFERSFDARYGGFGTAPKFPSPHQLLFLLRYFHRSGKSMALQMVQETLKAMRLGGIWDHVGFGFHRYSTDRQWLLPHFEKMLYDQALIAHAFLETYQITRSSFFEECAREIFTYVLRDMTSESGGFFTAEDADSEGEEGKFYVWSFEEFRSVLGDEALTFEKIFNLKPEGNFLEEATGKKTGANILHLNRPIGGWAAEAEPENGTDRKEIARQWEKARRKLFDAREKRIHPLKDDKVLTGWNGLMIAAMAMGKRILNEASYGEAAERAMRFILGTMRKPDGRLLHRFRDQETAIEAHADDYAYLILGLLELYSATFKPVYLEEAVVLQRLMLDDFWDEAGAGFYLTARGQKELPVRPKELYDGATPSANSVALCNLLRLSRLTGDTYWEAKASDMTHVFAGSVKKQPTAFTYFLIGFDFAGSQSREVVIAGDPESAQTQRMITALNKEFAPHRVVMLKSEKNAEALSRVAGFTDALRIVEGKATAHMCKGFSCTESTGDFEKMAREVLERVNLGKR
jgi:uncharacterized protein YyaL (SSP411 family)